MDLLEELKTAWQDEEDEDGNISFFQWPLKVLQEDN